MDEALVDSSKILQYNEDSCAVFLQNIRDNEIKVVLNTPSFQDTNTVRVLDKVKQTNLKPKPLNDLSQLLIGSPIGFEVNALITSVDTSKIKIKAERLDTVTFVAFVEGNMLFLKINNPTPSKGQITLMQNTMSNQSGCEQDSVRFNFEIKSADAFGKILIDGSKLEGPVLVYLMQKDKLIARESLSVDGKCSFNQLVPGEYALSYVFDENNNGKWDTGDLLTRQLPERVIGYPGVVKVRRNWDLELVLQDIKDE